MLSPTYKYRAYAGLRYLTYKVNLGTEIEFVVIPLRVLNQSPNTPGLQRRAVQNQKNQYLLS